VWPLRVNRHLPSYRARVSFTPDNDLAAALRQAPVWADKGEIKSSQKFLF